MENRGVDLSRERTVDFSHIFETETDAGAFIRACSELGFDAKNTTDDQTDHLDVTVSLVMTPNCSDITETEQRLGELAERHNGRSDGWGFWSS